MAVSSEVIASDAAEILNGRRAGLAKRGLEAVESLPLPGLDEALMATMVDWGLAVDSSLVGVW